MIDLPSEMQGALEALEAASTKELAGTRILSAHPLIVTIAYAANLDRPVVITPVEVWTNGRELLAPWRLRFEQGDALLILIGETPEELDRVSLRSLCSVVARRAASPSGAGQSGGTNGHGPSPAALRLAVARALELLEARSRLDRESRSVDRYRVEMGELVDVARAISTERDLGKLLGVILESSRTVTGADAGSVYVVEGDGGERGDSGHPDKRTPDSRSLRFKLSQNDSLSFASSEFTIPLNMGSIAGVCAIEKRSVSVDDVYNLPKDSPFGFDRRFDERSGYRTKSMLVVPLVSRRDEVIGVIQLINKKRDPRAKLATPADAEREVVPFDARSADLLAMVAAQAGVSLENTLLYEEIRQLFEGFVKASVEAIESRDPTTSGHSRRVADYTVGLAKVVDGAVDGKYGAAKFSREDIQELEYASLLHDFGKIGVREKVLVKAKKLHDEELSVIRSRFDFVAKSIEAELLSKKVQLLEKAGPRGSLEALDRELVERLAELEASFGVVLQANEPSVLAAGDFEKVAELARRNYADLQGNAQMWLQEREAGALSVKRGSLTDAEFDEIRSHVTHTFRFLSRIPWGKALRRVPQIAGAHHERLNGTGYPNKLREDDIPLQSKIMSIADIFDALTASDRPYKKAVPIDKALDILSFSVKDGHLDAELVKIFQQAKVWEAPKNS